MGKDINAEKHSFSRHQWNWLLNQLEQEQAGVHSVMVWEEGKVLWEHWWSPYAPEKKHTLFSVSKTFTGLAVGFAVEEGLLSLSDRVVSFFPEYLPSPVCENMAKMTVKNLLTMATGMERDPHDFYEKRREDFQETSPCCYHGFQPDLTSDWIRNFFSHYVKYEPGTEFVYCTHGSYMLSAIVQKATGKTTAQYLNEKFFQPLGIRDLFWESGPDGRTVGGWGLMLKTEDLLKTGVFLLQKGNWQGNQLLCKSWVEQATSVQIPIKKLPEEPNTAGYGYQIWIDRREHAFSLRGAFGQFCMVFPERRMVIAVTSGASERMYGRIMELIWESLDMCPTSSNSRALKGHIAWPEGIPSWEQPEARRVSGIRYQLADNFLRLRAVTFCLGGLPGEPDQLTLEMETGTFSVPVGYECWKEGKTCVRTKDTDTDTSIFFEHTACAGAWKGQTYRVRMCFDETAYINDWEFTFGADSIWIQHCRNCTFFAAVNLTIAGRY